MSLLINNFLTSGWLYFQMSLAAGCDIYAFWLDNKDPIETKVQIPKSIIHFSKSICHVSPLSLPSRSTENLKTGKILLLSNHTEAIESVPSYQLLHHDIDTKKKSWEKLPLQGEFSYTSLYWEWLEDVFTRCRGLLVVNHLLDPLYLSFFCLWQVSKSFGQYVDTGAQKQKSLHNSKGKVSISLLDIHGFLGLPFSRFLYE